MDAPAAQHARLSSRSGSGELSGNLGVNALAHVGNEGRPIVAGIDQDAVQESPEVIAVQVLALDAFGAKLAAVGVADVALASPLRVQEKLEGAEACILDCDAVKLQKL